jgi:hypothetical protein
MSMPNLEVAWRETIAGQSDYNPNNPNENDYEEQVDPYAAEYEATMGFHEAVKMLAVDHTIATKMYEHWGMQETQYADERSTIRGRVLMLGPNVQGAAMALMTGAIQHAKSRGAEPVRLAVDEWARLGFEARDISYITGMPEAGFQRKMTGSDDPEDHRVAIGLVANFIMGGALLRDQVSLVFAQEVAAFRVVE